MESTLASVDLGRYRRIVQMFWDPEPTNDRSRNLAVWCLGQRYRLAGSCEDASSSTDTAGSSVAGDQPAPMAATPATRGISPASPSSEHQGTSDSQAGKGPDTATTSTVPVVALDEDRQSEDGGWPPAFLDDIESKIWMTYRSEFQPILKSNDPRAAQALSLSMRIKSQLVDHNGFTSDTGWGCMIRSGQSLLANTMVFQTLGRDWRRGIDPDREKEILSKFADDPKAKYSLHQFVQHGAAACGKYPGEWFGPSATARCIQALVQRNEPQLRVYFTGDGPDVYRDRFMHVAKPEGDDFHPTLILVGTRLGIDKITPVYWEALIAALQLPQSVGIAGGRPSSSHYFVGAQSPFLFYLDPHFTRPALPFHEDPSHYTSSEVDSAHTRRLRRLHIKEMDPSMLIGFLIRDEDDWEDWSRAVKHVQGKAVIHVLDHDPLNMGGNGSRQSAIDEVESLSDDAEEGDIFSTRS